MSILRRYFERQHQQPLPFWLWLFYPTCLVYSAVASFRSILYQFGVLKSTRLPIPVISIGNITTGGTGKTPIVIALCNYLIEQGKKVVVLSRGYGAKLPQNYAQAISPNFGDEAYLIQQAVPKAVVIVGRKRRDNALKTIDEFKPDVIILDDGFQYLPLERDVNICLIDGEQGFGNDHLLPLGPLREPLSALSRATSFVITKNVVKEQLNDIVQTVHQYAAPDTFSLPPTHWPFKPVGIFNAENNQVMSEQEIQGKIPVMVSGIARPATFLQSLMSLGIEVPTKQQFIFSDHHNYTTEDIATITQAFPNSLIITTEKDWVKLKPLIQDSNLTQWAYLRIEPKIPAHSWQDVLAPVITRLGLVEKVPTP